VIISIPIAVLVLFAQRRIVSGLTAGLVSAEPAALGKTKVSK